MGTPKIYWRVLRPSGILSQPMKIEACAILAALLFHSLSVSAQQGETAAAAGFSKDIAPILTKKCVACHGPEKSKGRFRLDTFEFLMKGGESKSASVVPGQPAQSELFRRLTARDEDDRMPQKDDPLPAAQISLIEQWINAGAKFDGPDPKAPLVTLIPRAPHPEPPSSYHHPVPILALAFNPDGTELAAGGYHEITIWNPNEGTLLRRIKNVAQRTHSLDYSPDGALLAAAGGSPGQWGEVAVFNPTNGARVRVLGAMPDTALTVSFSPDGSRLAAGGADNSLRVYDVGSCRLPGAAMERASPRPAATAPLGFTTQRRAIWKRATPVIKGRCLRWRSAGTASGFTPPGATKKFTSGTQRKGRKPARLEASTMTFSNCS
ncbi:MAG: hypothetical protein DME19_10675 [Verrucomicrobia bacterium]|nr:MAG: hypothetical protein DME19_10675 [Verrucomicrobiota bacterium]